MKKLCVLVSALSSRCKEGRPGVHLLLLSVLLTATTLIVPLASVEKEGTSNSWLSDELATKAWEALGEKGRESADYDIEWRSNEANGDLRESGNAVAKSNDDGLAVVKPRGTAYTVPILMYHYVRVNPDPSDTIGAGLSVSPPEFERQMRFLVQNGYQVIGLEDLVNQLRKGAPPVAGSVVLTFDDGYADFGSEAYPVLRRYNLKATAFIVTGFVGSRGYLTWDAIGEMAAGGLVSFGSHTISHADLSALPLNLAEIQIKESKSALEERLGRRASLFAYPSGRYNEAVMRLVEKVGYLGAVTTRFGNTHTANDIYQLKRIRIDGRDDLSTFIGKLRYIEGAVAARATAMPSPTPSKPATLPPVALSSPSPVREETSRPQRLNLPATPTRSVSSELAGTNRTTVVVPDIVGLSEPEARAQLNMAGLNAGYTNYQSVDDVRPENRAFFLSILPGHVVSQQPEAGRAVRRGDTVLFAVRK